MKCHPPPVNAGAERQARLVAGLAKDRGQGRNARAPRHGAPGGMCRAPFKGGGVQRGGWVGLAGHPPRGGGVQVFRGAKMNFR